MKWWVAAAFFISVFGSDAEGLRLQGSWQKFRGVFFIPLGWRTVYAVLCFYEVNLQYGNVSVA